MKKSILKDISAGAITSICPVDVKARKPESCNSTSCPQRLRTTRANQYTV
ncbi:MAG TPA: hypothetical protein GX707_12170 [Epulopiscium sp.]|nr:hypothetical protein [Candidatus Epulonipiscium sp.]